MNDLAASSNLAHWPLALDRVRHVGEPVAVVVVQSAERSPVWSDHSALP